MLYLSHRYPKGHLFFEEGDLGTLGYIVRAGRVRITKHRENQQLVLAILGKGEIFGEMALLGTETRTATAQAIEDTEVIPLSPANLAGVLHKTDPILRHLIGTLVTRLKRTTDAIYDNLVSEQNAPREESQSDRVSDDPSPAVVDLSPIKR